MIAQASKDWIVELICCGREDGTYVASTWAEADAFRESVGPGWPSTAIA